MPETQPKVIKRYSNRKLYDTERSCYVTLEEIAQMVKEGVEVKIVDNKTKEDLTTVTLTQIIFAEEKKQKSILPLSTLREIIRSGGESLSELFQAPARRIETFFGRKPEDAVPAGNGAAPVTETVEPPLEEPEVEFRERSLRDWFEEQRALVEASAQEWQRRIDENMKESFGSLTVLPKIHLELERVNQRLDDLERRLSKLEER